MARCIWRDPQTGWRCTLEAEDGQSLCRGCAREEWERRCAYEGWMLRVQEALADLCGLHPDDLPDCPYADWHTSGMEPGEAARQALAGLLDGDAPG